MGSSLKEILMMPIEVMFWPAKLAGDVASMFEGKMISLIGNKRVYIPGYADLAGKTTKEAFLANAQSTKFKKELSLKRNLTADEYSFYYAYMLSDETPDYLKAAIAVVLDADLKILYKGNYSSLKDDLILENIEVFKNLWGLPKMKAIAEIRDFDAFLHTDLPGSVKAEKAQSGNQAIISMLMQAQNAQNKEQKIRDIFIKELTKEKEESDKKAKTRQDQLVSDAIRKYTMANLRRYLGAYYEAHQISLMMDNKISEVEFKVRMFIIDGVENKKANPVKALAAYVKALNYMMKSLNLNVLTTNLKRDMGLLKHPLFSKVSL